MFSRAPTSSTAEFDMKSPRPEGGGLNNIYIYIYSVTVVHYFMIVDIMSCNIVSRYVYYCYCYYY